MLFAQRFVPGMADGTVTVTFRRWRRPQAVVGRRYRTPAGMIAVDALDEVDPAAITDDDARRAGYPDAAALRADLRGPDDAPVLRVAFHVVDEPDPRALLAADDDLGADDVAAITARLARLDAAAPDGPWTAAVLALIAEQPAVRAGDLAARLGRERLAFKADVRKLKALGLTESLPVGYRLSPRGEAYRRAVSPPPRG